MSVIVTLQTFARSGQKRVKENWLQTERGSNGKITEKCALIMLSRRVKLWNWDLHLS